MSLPAAWLRATSAALAFTWSTTVSADTGIEEATEPAGKPVVYQVFTRLFGNTNTTNKPWGTVEENGVGKFSDFTDRALGAITELGVTHIWYTGVLHHALIRDYSEFGIDDDDPDVVKGRAGSPYAVKDYYAVNPDLADDPARGLEEFRALVQRTHERGMRVIIDIVPNHVARRYRSLGKPAGVADFGAADDSSVAYRRDNNFYYAVGEPFRVPAHAGGYRPLGGAPHPLADGKFAEFPAKWTGNGSRASQPAAGDWYETVKINYGVRPDGRHDFPDLPADLRAGDYREHAAFWRDRDVPDSWKKVRDIALFWLDQGVDGFRYDVAELVPVEFWSYLNSTIKQQYPGAFLLAEIYDEAKYRDYIAQGKMDYLYNKVELYDALRAVVEGKEDPVEIIRVRELLADIDPHMLAFLENHDEHRIASPDFAGDPDRARPAMVVAATISAAPIMIYFGQEVGEAATGDAGFGKSGRTTIFDYWGVPAHQRWMNGGAFDGGQLSARERSLRDFYRRLLNYVATAPVMAGHYAEIHRHNLALDRGYGGQVFSFVRWNADERLIVVTHLDADRSVNLDLSIPAGLIRQWDLPDGSYELRDALRDGPEVRLRVKNREGRIELVLAPLQSVLLQLSG